MYLIFNLIKVVKGYVIGCLYSVRYKMGNKLAIRCLNIEKKPSYRVEFQ